MSFDVYFSYVVFVLAPNERNLLVRLALSDSDDPPGVYGAGAVLTAFAFAWWQVAP